ncbi:NAD(P)-dependent oxidoreductase, partial [bacterium]
FAARGFALQLLTGMNGMRLVGIANRTISYGELAYTQAGQTAYEVVTSQEQCDAAAREKRYILTQNPHLLTDSQYVDVIVEATGEVEAGCQVVLRAIEQKKHVVLLNAELDTTLGPILKKKADEAGVVYTQADGDQPGVLMNLYRYVSFLGFKPVMAGNIKSLIDPRRTPETQKRWADEHFQRPKMVTSFADGTKISYEMATVANATGFTVSVRGMEGPKATHVDEAPKKFSCEELLKHGRIDYILGAEPSFGVFILGYSDQPIKKRYMNVYKMGEGPLYTFYTPYHLSPLEAPLSVARAVLFRDVCLAPTHGSVCDVVPLAKRDLKQGEILDGIGGFTCYGAIDNTPVLKQNNIIPMGLTDGCILKRDIPMDQEITYDDIVLPDNRLCDSLIREQS